MVWAGSYYSAVSWLKSYMDEPKGLFSNLAKRWIFVNLQHINAVTLAKRLMHLSLDLGR